MTRTIMSGAVAALAALTPATGLAQTAAAAATPQFGTDTRALHFFGVEGFQYAGGYGSGGTLADNEEYLAKPNGATSSLLDYSFQGHTYAGNGSRSNGSFPVTVKTFGSADLANGKLQVYATDPVFSYIEENQTYSYFNQSRTNASFQDVLSLSFDPSLAGQYVTIGIRDTLSGTVTLSAAPSSAASVNFTLNAYSALISYTYPNGGGFYNQQFGKGAAIQTDLVNYGNAVFGFDFTIPAINQDIKLLSLLSANAYGSTVDYSHTSTLSLVLPKGVSYTSASGTFLSAADSPLPEPASWATMIAGFATLGAALRRRPRMPARALHA